MALKVLVVLCAAFAVISANIAPLSYPPSINSAASGSETITAGQILNKNAYAKDESKIRQLSTTLANSAEGTREFATATSEPIGRSPIETIYPYYSAPAEKSYPYYTAPLEFAYPLPAEKSYPYYTAPVELAYPFAAEKSYPYYTAPVELAYPFPAEKSYPYYSAPAELAYPYFASPVEYSYPYYNYPVDKGYYSYPTVVPSLPYYAPSSESFYPKIGAPTTGYIDVPYSIPSGNYYGSPLGQKGGLFGEQIPAVGASPVDFVDATLFEAFYPEFPVQSHYSATNVFNKVSASANPISSSSEVVSDNTAYSKDVIPFLKSL